MFMILFPTHSIGHVIIFSMFICQQWPSMSGLHPVYLQGPQWVKTTMGLDLFPALVTTIMTNLEQKCDYDILSTNDYRLND